MLFRNSSRPLTNPISFQWFRMPRSTRRVLHQLHKSFSNFAKADKSVFFNFLKDSSAVLVYSNIYMVTGCSGMKTIRFLNV